MFKGILKIESPANPVVKHLVKLRENKNYRIKHQSAIVCGKVLVKEIATQLPPHLILIENQSDLPEGIVPKRVYQTTPSVLKKITNQPAPVGIVAEFPIPSPTALTNKTHVIACDGISDPGNMGMLIRSMLAFGWDGIFLLPGCVDLFHEKCISASRGAVFFISSQAGNWEELKQCIVSNQLVAFCADLEGKKISQVSPPKRVLLLLSHESRGLTKEGESIGEKITIPIIQKNMESLNVAAAGSIFMHYLRDSSIDDNGIAKGSA